MDGEASLLLDACFPAVTWQFRYLAILLPGKSYAESGVAAIPDLIEM